MNDHDIDISGHWIFQSKIEGGVTGKGALINRVETYELAIQLIQEGQVLKGMYLAATEGMCGKASLSGTVVDNKIEWLVEYIDCSDICKTFKGEVIREGGTLRIVGNTTPVNTPTRESSWSGYETFVGLKSRTRVPELEKGIYGRLQDALTVKPGILGISLDLKKLFGKITGKP